MSSSSCHGSHRPLGLPPFRPELGHLASPSDSFSEAGPLCSGSLGGSSASAGGSSHNARRTIILTQRDRASTTSRSRASPKQKLRHSNCKGQGNNSYGNLHARKYSRALLPSTMSDRWQRWVASWLARTGSPVQWQQNLHLLNKWLHILQIRNSHNHPADSLDGGTPSQHVCVKCPHHTQGAAHHSCPCKLNAWCCSSTHKALTSRLRMAAANGCLAESASSPAKREKTSLSGGTIGGCQTKTCS